MVLSQCTQYSMYCTVYTVQYVLYMQCLDPQEICSFSVYFLLAGPPPPGVDLIDIDEKEVSWLGKNPHSQIHIYYTLVSHMYT